MELRIVLSKGSSEQQEAHLTGYFVQDLIKFCEENTRLKLKLNEGVEWANEGQTLIFSTNEKEFANLLRLQRERNKLNREISTLKKATLKN